MRAPVSQQLHPLFGVSDFLLLLRDSSDSSREGSRCVRAHAIRLGPHIKSNNFPFLRSVPFITSAKSLLPHNVTCLLAWELGHGHLRVAIILPTVINITTCATAKV